MIIKPETWRPAGIEDLEPAAWEALREDGSTCVVAGPGAGKTEFLAQRAAYLLQTGICRPPYRILAISFKRDAAENLAARVRKRCTREHSARFTSLTFDAFTKGLIDRFRAVVPERWRPSRPYSIVFPSRRDTEEFLTRARTAAPRSWQAEIAALQPSTFEARNVGGWRLPEELGEPESAAEFAVQKWWTERYAKDETALTFIALNRLADLLQRTSPQIGRALRVTYPFVFVDEFQDTTFAQYDLLLSAFGQGSTTITAVGDDKQRIMEWAGARSDAFSRFEQDFSAQRIPLRFNYRSSPELVRIQHVIAKALDAGSVEIESKVDRIIDGDVAQVWSFDHLADEAWQIASWIAEDISQRGMQPRDYAILVRQQANNFEKQLQPAFTKAGLSLRNESKAVGKTTLQDLLVEDLTLVSMAVLRLSVQRRAPEAWAVASDAIQRLRGVDPEDDAGSRRAEDELTAFVGTLRGELGDIELSENGARALCKRLFAFLDLKAFARSYLAYSSGDNLKIAANAFFHHLADSVTDAEDWAAAFDIFEGRDSVPLMTVHKSKGLEYDTMLFMGLDDRMWWAYSAGNPEGQATFFVALSRAKQRAIFTFCGERGARRRIAELYQLLAQAGVPEIPFPRT